MKKILTVLLSLILVAGAVFTLTGCGGDKPPKEGSPSAPRDFSVATGETSATLSWAAPESAGDSVISKYEVSKDNKWVELPASARSHTFTGLNKGTEYTFRVRAVNGQGGGEIASEKAFTTGDSGSGESVGVVTGNLIINKIYATGNNNNNEQACSHSFIELYNDSNEAVNLSGWSVQIKRPGHSWHRLRLNGTVGGKTSFLIRLSQYSNVRTDGTKPVFVLDNTKTGANVYKFDMDWADRYLHNKTQTVVLMSITHKLDDSVVNPSPVTAGFVDMIGYHNSDSAAPEGFREAPLSGYSKNRIAYRLNFGDDMTFDNSLDFRTRRINNPDNPLSEKNLERVRPRHTGNGPWDANDVIND